MKKLICIILLISLINIPSLSFYESGDAFISIEGETGISDSSVRGYFTEVDDADASGKKAMKTKVPFPDSSETQSPSEKPLSFEVNVTAGRYKIYMRIKGQDSVMFSLNGMPYERTWFNWDSDEYKWILLTEKDFISGKNVFSLSSRKPSLYVDKIIITDSLLYYPVGIGQDISEGSGLDEIYEKPDFYPKKGIHPRVLLNSARVSEIRKNLKHKENEKVYEKVLSALNNKNDGNLNVNLSDNEDVKALDRIEANAFMYQMTGLEKYADTAISVMTNYLSSMKYPANTLQDIRQRGGVIFRASLVYDWCHDAECFTYEKKEKIAELILKQAGHLECGWPPVNLSAFDSGHGWENSIVKDLFAFSIAVYDEFPEIYECVAGRVFSEFIPAANYHYERGDFFNRAGDDYGIYRYEFEIYLALLLNGMGADGYINENQRNVAYQAITRLKPDNTRFRVGDIWTYGEKNPPEAYHMMLAASSLYKDGYLKQFFFDRFPQPHHIWNSVTGLSPMLYLVLNDTNVIRRARNELPLTINSGGDSGVITARTSWQQGKDSDAMAVSIRMPSKFYGGHQHLDAGSFEVFYKGPLAIDSGVYNSGPWTDENGMAVTNLAYGSEHDLNYHKRTIAHNSMLIYKEGETGFGIGTVNDGGQKSTTAYPHNLTAEEYASMDADVSKILSYETKGNPNKPDYTYVRGDLTGWYSEEKAENYERSFLFWNFFDEKYPGALIVFDNVTSKDKGYKKTWLLHSQQEPEIYGNRSVIRRNENGYNGRLINDTLLPENTVAEIIGGPGKEYFAGGKNYNAVPLYEPTDESGNYRIEISPKEEKETDLFLNVIQVSEDNDEILPLKTELYEDELFAGVKINKKVALFCKNREMLSESFSVSDVKSYGEKEYAICGLESGSWKVSDGEKEEILTVADGGNTIFFSSKGGKIDVSFVSGEKEEKINGFFDSFSVLSSPYLETFPSVYKSPFETAIVSKYLLDNGYELSGYGVMYSKIKGADINDDGVMLFPATSKDTLNGGFGVSLIDYKGKLYGNYYLKPYVAYKDNGELKYAYGDERYIAGSSSLIRMPISWEMSIADRAYSIDPTLNITNPTVDKILTDVAVYPSVVASNIASDQYRNSMAFLRLDISRFDNLDITKPVVYNLYGAFGTDIATVDSAVIEIYEADNNAWSYIDSEDISSGVAVATDIEKVVSGVSPIASAKVSRRGGYWVSATEAEHYSFDITDSVKKCIDENKSWLTLAVRINVSDIPANGITRLRIWQTSTNTSDISYYSFNE